MPLILRIAFANTFDSRGGAARAAYRLFTGVYALPGLDVKMVVQDKCTDHPGVVTPAWGLTADTASRLDACDLKAAHPNRVRAPFSVNWFPGKGISVLRELKPDIVHMHWPHCGFIRIEGLVKLDVPIIWTIHDMWAFTGVCHYSQKCKRYMIGCGQCPLLASDDPDDVSYRVYRRKASTYPKLDLTVVSPSNWLADLARASPLLRHVPVTVIPNGIDTGAFSPRKREDARQRLSLPKDRILLAFGADSALADGRKGAALLFDALASRPLAECELAVFGSDCPAEPPELPMRVHWIGPVWNDDVLADIYSAANLFVAPSLQENLSNMVMEALACGTPVIAFDIGGMGDLIDDGESGVLIPEADGGIGLCTAIEALAGDTRRLTEMGRAARQSVLERFILTEVADRYARLYTERFR